MYCWGGTVSGELGLGGIEEQQVRTPRHLATFPAGTQIVQGRQPAFITYPSAANILGTMHGHWASSMGIRRVGFAHSLESVGVSIPFVA